MAAMFSQAGFLSKWAKLALASVMTLGASVLIAPSVSAAGTLDQSQTLSDTIFIVCSNTESGQTFTAGITGVLDQVDLLLQRGGSLAGPVRVEIRSVNLDGTPSSGPPLAFAVVPAANVPLGTPGWVSVPLSGAQVVAGTMYAIVVSATASPCGASVYRWLAASGNPYPRGSLAFSFDAGATWGLVTAYDHAFKTYVSPPAPTCTEADGNGDFQGNHGHGNFQTDNDNCEENQHGGNGNDQGDRVDSSDRGDHQDFHSTKIESTKFDSEAHTMTTMGIGTTAGKTVAFTLVALETGNGVPGWVSMTFSDGYTNAGNLLSGSISLH